MSFFNQLFLIISILISTSLSAQHYITIGGGITGSSVSSNKLDNFRKTYNDVNYLFLTEKLKGFDFGLGVRPMLGYRYFSEYNTAILIGYQTLNDIDIAKFTDGSVRKIELDLTALFLEYEFGYNWGDFFTNGLITFNFNRQIKIKNTYQTNEPDSVSSFTGTFKGGSTSSTDIGVAIGAMRSSFFIVLKVTYPLYTGGKSNVLTDSKKEENLEKFPSDYHTYVMNQPYKAVTSDIDGLKIILTLNYAFELNK